MKRILLIILLAVLSVSLVSGQDTVLNRNVTVEREFQPVIQSAGKVDQRPATLNVTIEPAQVTYSDYSTVLNPDFNLSSLPSQSTSFRQGTPLHGYLRGAIGHPHTWFDFTYRVDDHKKSLLDVYAHHRAQWGRKTNARTKLGFNFTHQFSSCDLYFGLMGGNRYYTRYGKYYDGDNGLTVSKLGDMADNDKVTLWIADVFIGVKSKPRADWQYKVQTGYQVFHRPDKLTQHTLTTMANVEWNGSSSHHGGINYLMKNYFFRANPALIADSLYNSRHAFRIEPFYAYHGDRFMLHLGVNLDFNIGKGSWLSSSDNITFAPSPNIRFEAQLAKEWVTLYGNILGNHGLCGIDADLRLNPYYDLGYRLQSHSMSSHTPIDAELGFHIRPHKHLLMEIHAGYMYQFGGNTWLARLNNVAGSGLYMDDYRKFNTDHQRIKVGAAFSYHYQDIVNIHLWGDYFAWRRMKSDFDGAAGVEPDRVFDRPDWELGLRVDGRIDRNWSLYSVNHFAGSRWALVQNVGTLEEHHLKPTIQMDLGCKYEWPELNLEFFLQLNNIICRHNDIFYGYQSLGINGIAGAAWRF